MTRERISLTSADIVVFFFLPFYTLKTRKDADFPRDPEARVVVASNKGIKIRDRVDEDMQRIFSFAELK